MSSMERPMADFGGLPRIRGIAGTYYFRPLADDDVRRRTVTGWASGAVGRGFKSLRARQVSQGYAVVAGPAPVGDHRVRDEPLFPDKGKDLSSGAETFKPSSLLVLQNQKG